MKTYLTVPSGMVGFFFTSRLKPVHWSMGMVPMRFTESRDVAANSFPFPHRVRGQGT